MEDTPKPIAELDHGPSKLDAFLEENQKKLVIAAVLIFLAVLGYVFWNGYAQMKQQNAGELVPMASTEEELTKIFTDRPDSRAAAAAKILLADLKGNTAPDEAIEQLRDTIAKYPNHPATPKAQTALGLLLLDQSKLDEAEASLNSVLDKEEAAFIAPYAKIGLADIAAKKGQKDRARSLYTEVIDLIASGDPDTIQQFNAYAEIAKSRLRIIDAAPPKKVKPAPVEPTPAPTNEDSKPESPAAPEETPVTPTPASQPTETPAPTTQNEKNSKELPKVDKNVETPE